MTNPRSALVTGANGFIGRHLVRRLVGSGHTVTILQRSTNYVSGAKELLRVDPFSPDTISAVLSGRRFDWVFHLASYGVNPQDREIEPMFRVNVDATRRLIEIASCWTPRALVLVGTGSEYNANGIDRPLSEDHPLEHFKLHGASKAAGTLASAAIARARNAPFAAARIFGVYGPGEAPHRLLPSLINGLRSMHRVPLTHGRQKRDFLFVEDVVNALIMLAESLERKPCQIIVNIGTGKPISVGSFAKTVAAALGAPIERLGFGDISMGPDGVMVFSGDPSLVRKVTGWQPRIDLDQGIRLSIAKFDDERSMA
jgi:nucleoside-diphosphate-sugar epimerase